MASRSSGKRREIGRRRPARDPDDSISYWRGERGQTGEMRAIGHAPQGERQVVNLEVGAVGGEELACSDDVVEMCRMGRLAAQPIVDRCDRQPARGHAVEEQLRRRADRPWAVESRAEKPTTAELELQLTVPAGTVATVELSNNAPIVANAGEHIWSTNAGTG